MQAVKDFDAFRDSVPGRHGPRSSTEAPESDASDTSLTKFVDHLFLSGEAPGAARYTIYGFCHVHGIPSRSAHVLPKSKQALKGFVRSCPKRVRDPPPFAAFLVVVQAILMLGCHKHLLAAALLFLSFDAYLRPSEGLRLRRADVTPPTHGQGRSSWVLTIAPQGGVPAKNRQHDCSVTVGFAGRDWASLILAALYRSTSCESDLLFGDLGLGEVEKFCRIAAKQLKLPVRVDPHSMRHAGPSIDMYNGVTTLAEVQTRGRWLSADSVRRYAKPAGLLRQLKKLSSTVLCEAAAFSSLPFDVAARLDPSGGLATDQKKKRKRV